MAFLILLTHVIGTGSVDTGDWNVVESEVNTQLGAVVDHLAKGVAYGFQAGEGHVDLISVSEGPVFEEDVIFGCFKIFNCLVDIFIEKSNVFIRRIACSWVVRVNTKVEFIGCQGSANPGGNVSHVVARSLSPMLLRCGL